MTVWCAGLDEVHTCTPNTHLYRVTYTRCHIDTINSPDDGRMATRNMYRIEINIHEKEFNFNLFSVHLIHEGYDPSDMELVNTEIRLQISYMKYS